MHYDIDKYFDQEVLIGNYIESGVNDLGEAVGPDGWVDGGDTCHRVGMYYLGMLYNDINEKEDFSKAIDLLKSTKDPGIIRRHNDERFWYSNDNRMSRDQITSVLAALGAYGMKKELFQIFLSHLKRGLLFTSNTRRNGSTKENHGMKFHSNAKPLTKFDKFILKYRIPILNVTDGYRNYNWKLPDITGPSIWAMYIRGFNLLPLYPLLCILDIEYFINSILKRTLVKKDIDVLNHVIEGVYSAKKMVTPLVYLANKFINKSTDMINKMKKYFSPKRAPYFVGDIYESIIKKVMS